MLTGLMPVHTKREFSATGSFFKAVFTSGASCSDTGAVAEAAVV